MSDSVIQQLTARLPKTLQPQTEEADTVDDYGAFGWLRGIRDRALMIEFRKKDGSVMALPYMMLERVDYDPSVGITLNFATQTVKIVGRNLNGEVRPNVALLNGILRHKVPWIRASGSKAILAADKHTTVLESIEW